MKIGIFGLPLAGKKTIFKILTGVSPGEESRRQEPVEGLTQINDPRLERLGEIYKPKRTVKARLYLELLPDFEGEAAASGKIFTLLGSCDALCCVVRLFPDDSVYHPEGSVNPERDIRRINSELLLHDLAFAEKRIEKLQKEKKSGPDGPARELELMIKLKNAIEEEIPLRALEMRADEKAAIAGYPFLTLKPMTAVLNLGEEEQEYSKKSLDSILDADKIVKVELRAKLESEIDELPPGREREEILEAMGISMPAAETLKKSFLRTLNLATFFTASSDELRQWLAAAGSRADKAAGRIHTDMERGFIRAEVIKYRDLLEAGSEENAAAAGKKMLKGRDYTVEDGDILNIRFNV